MKPDRRTARWAVALAAALLLTACGKAPGYPGEPTSGIGGVAWKSPAAEDWKSSEGLPGALPARVISFSPLGGTASGLKSYYRSPKDSLFGLPEARPQYLVGPDGLAAIVMTVDASGKSTLTDSLGEPHETVEDGTFTEFRWTGKTVDVELRTGGQAGGDGMLFVMHREALLKLKK